MARLISCCGVMDWPCYNGKPDPKFAQHREATPLPPSSLATSLAVCHEYAPLEDGEPPRRPVILHIEDQHLPSE